MREVNQVTDDSVLGLNVDIFIGIIAASVCALCCLLTTISVIRRSKNDYMHNVESGTMTIVVNGKESKKGIKRSSEGTKHIDANSKSFDALTSKSNDISGTTKTSKEKPSPIPVAGYNFNDSNQEMVEMGNGIDAGDITPMYPNNDPRTFPARNDDHENNTDEGDDDDEEKTGMMSDVHETVGGTDHIHDGTNGTNDGIAAIMSMVMNDPHAATRSWTSNLKQFGDKLNDDAAVQDMVMNDILKEMEQETGTQMGDGTNNGYMHVKSNGDNKVKSSQEMVMVQGMVLDDIIDELDSLDSGSSTSDGKEESESENEDEGEGEDNESE